MMAAACLLAACTIGPKYQRPPAPAPQAYRETPPADFKEWQQAHPSDGKLRGKWWEIYGDPDLNALEEQVNVSNQTVLAAEGLFRQAQDAVRIARTDLFPTATVSPSYSNSRSSATLTTSPFGNLGTRNTFTFPLNVSYVPDVFGVIRRSIHGTQETAQATFAQLENVRLTLQATLAQDYFTLRGTDGDLDLLDRTVKSYEQYLELTKNRFTSGVASGGDVAQAETQLETARAQLIDLRVARAQLEHAIAVLTGRPPAEVAVHGGPITIVPPPVPVSVPSTLLERRPDVAAMERQMEAMNEQIGIARAAFFPLVSLSATMGLQSVYFSKWWTWPSRFWSLGPQAIETVFDAGKRTAEVQAARDAYDTAVANYRQTVLTGFQQVEDNLAALRILADEAVAEDAAVKAAQKSLDISTYQYKAGTVSYLQVITTQTVALQDERAAIDILTRRMVASVLLVEALGGGWDATQMPARDEVASK